MNEETNVELMDDDNFFDPADFEEIEETGDHTEEIDAAEEQPAEEVETEPTDTTQQPAEPEEQPQTDQPELFELNYMGNIEKHTREEMIALAQMGKDRGRILQQRDELQNYRSQNEPILNELNRISKEYGMNPTDLLTAFERNRLRSEGRSDAEADAILQKNKAERQLQAANDMQRQIAQQNEAKRRMQMDGMAFQQKYPGVRFEDVPDEVWNDVRRGETLVNAYGRYEANQLRAENQRLQQELATHKQNEENKQKSIGSMKSGSQVQKIEPFMEGFMSG